MSQQTYSPTSHLVRSVFTSYGLYGPITEEQMSWALQLAGESSLDSAGQSVAPRPAIYRNRPISLQWAGLAVLASDLEDFTSLDEVMNLVLLMCAYSSLAQRVLVFLNTQVCCQGQFIRLDSGFIAEMGSGTSPATANATEGPGYVLYTRRSRRGHLVLVHIHLEPEYLLLNWEAFTKHFGEYGQK